jgi:hypothetical protein
VAVAFDTMVDEAASGAVRSKHTRERVRAVRGGAFGHGRSFESRAAQQSRDREVGRLDEVERAELLYLWSGYMTDMGVRSSQGPLEDHLRRSPPRLSTELEDAVDTELQRRGQQGAPRDRLVEILAAENIGATRHEARLILRRMVRDGRAQFFVVDITRKRACVCRSLLGEVEGTPRHREPCTCGSGEDELVPTEMVRLLETRDRGIPARIPREDRWARADAALEASWQMLAVSETQASPGSRLPPRAPSDAMDAARDALRRLTPAHRHVLEAVYGSMGQPRWAGQLSPEAARLAPMCPIVERARLEMVEAQARARGLPPEATRTLGRSVFAADVIRAKLDAAPEDEVARIRWRLDGESFKGRLEREAIKLLEGAVREFRAARDGGIRSLPKH